MNRRPFLRNLLKEHEDLQNYYLGLAEYRREYPAGFSGNREEINQLFEFARYHGQEAKRIRAIIRAANLLY